MANRAKITAETDLYAPVHDYLVSQGYTVRGEVRNCDVVAVRGDDLIVIELKRAINLSLLAQAIDRQKITDSVYVAVPRPSNMRKWNAQTRQLQKLLRRLEIGLILVSVSPRSSAKGSACSSPFIGEGSGERSSPSSRRRGSGGGVPSRIPQSEIRNPHSVTVLFHPVPFARKKRKSAHRAVLTEINGRSGDFNIGGSCGRKLVTAYREHAIRIACCLIDGPTSPKALRALGCCDKTTSILYTNVYGWFDRIDKGLYALNSKGRREINAYAGLVEQYRRKTAAEEAAQQSPPPQTRPSKPCPSAL